MRVNGIVVGTVGSLLNQVLVGCVFATSVFLSLQAGAQVVSGDLAGTVWQSDRFPNVNFIQAQRSHNRHHQCWQCIAVNQAQ